MDDSFHSVAVRLDQGLVVGRENADRFLQSSGIKLSRSQRGANFARGPLLSVLRMPRDLRIESRAEFRNLLELV